MATDKLSGSMEKEATRLLKLAKTQTFKDQIDAFKICVLWWAQSRRIGTAEDQTGSLLDAMRSFIDAPQTGERGNDGGTGGSPTGLPENAEPSADD